MSKKPLRSQAWFGGDSKDAIMHRSWMKNQGMTADSFRRAAGHRHLQYLVGTDTLQRAPPRALAERVKRGVLEAGGLSRGIPCHVTRRIQSSPNRHAVSQPGLHGC